MSFGHVASVPFVFTECLRPCGRMAESMLREKETLGTLRDPVCAFTEINGYVKSSQARWSLCVPPFLLYGLSYTQSVLCSDPAVVMNKRHFSELCKDRRRVSSPIMCTQSVACPATRKDITHTLSHKKIK